MRKLFAFLILAVSPAWASYNYTTPWIVSHTQVGATELNFPVLISTNSVIFSTSASGGHLLNSSGYDIVYSTFSDCHYLLHWDTETVNTTGSAQMNTWVQVPALSSTTDTVFYSCYGNSGITSYQGISTATWDSNYGGVWHYGNGITLNANDSTVNNNVPSSTNGTSATSGQIDGAAAFNGTSNYIVYPNATSLQATSNLTLSAWVYLTSYGSPNVSEEFLKKDSNYIFRFDNSGGGTTPFYNIFWWDGTNLNVSSLSAPALNSWHYFVAVVSGGAISAHYLDGVPVSVGNTNLGASARDVTQPEVVGGEAGGGGEWLIGNLDELRMSSSARSADWVLTEYNNQSSPNTFITPDTEVNNAVLNENEKGIVLDGGKMTIRGGKMTVL